MILKGALRKAEIPKDIDEWKMPTSKFGHFQPKTVKITFGKNSILRRKTNILLKASNQISRSENVALDTL